MENIYKLINLPLTRERFIRMPFPLLAFGETITNSYDSYNIPQLNTLEFCFRLESDETEAVDVIDGISYRNRFPHLFIKMPGHSLKYQLHSHRTAFFLIYAREEMSSFETAGFSFDHPFIPFASDAEITGLISGLRALFPYTQQFGVPDKADLLALQLIEAVCLQRGAACQQLPWEQEIRRIASYIQLHLSSNIDLEALASENGLSPRSFFRYWHKFYDLSPTQYLLTLRMNAARQLLESRNWQIARIGCAVGIENTSYFIHYFKQHFGTSPARYRKHFNLK